MLARSLGPWGRGVSWLVVVLASGCGSDHKAKIDASASPVEADGAAEGPSEDEEDAEVSGDAALLEDGAVSHDGGVTADAGTNRGDAASKPSSDAEANDAGTAESNDASTLDASETDGSASDASEIDGDASSSDAASSDAAAERDAAATPGDDEAGSISCAKSMGASEVCTLSNDVCCLGQGCQSKANACTNSVSVGCDGPEDCESGKVCCGTFGAQCVAQCDALVVCHVDADCASGDLCIGVLGNERGVCWPAPPVRNTDAGFPGFDGGFFFPDGGFRFPGFDAGFPFAPGG